MSSIGGGGGGGFIGERDYSRECVVLGFCCCFFLFFVFFGLGVMLL